MKPRAGLFCCLALALVTIPACAELGQLNIPGEYGPASPDMLGEVGNIDTRSRQIEIRTDTGRTWNIQYDNQTSVVYRERGYAVSNLEPGDYVAVTTQQDRDGRLYADIVTVRESVQERGGTGQQRGSSNRNRAGRLDRLEGTVEYIDSQRGQFEIRDGVDRIILVSLPYNAPRKVSEHFNRLREGDTVRLEGRFLNQDRFELENFV